MEEERKYCVYKHTSPSEKIYIGITCQKPEYRWKRNGVGYKSQTYFYRAIQKYGWDNFKHEILFENLTKKDAEKKERELITYYKSYDNKFGYNIDMGGQSIGCRSDSTKKKLSNAHKGKSYHGITIETRKLLSEMNSGENNPMFGKRHSKETREQMSINRRGKEHEWNRQKVYCVELNKLFNSMKEASKEFNLSITYICGVCNGRFEKAGSYHWLYVYDKVKKDGTIIQGALSLGYITEEEIENAKNSSI